MNDRECQSPKECVNSISFGKFSRLHHLCLTDCNGKAVAKETFWWSFYWILNKEEHLKPWPWKQIWKSRTPHKVICFSWIMANEACLTIDNL